MQADEVIFTVDRMAYVWEDVVIAGHVWGDWTTLEQRVRDGLACLARLDDVDDDALAEAVPCEAVCSGMAASLAERLAARAAVCARMRDEGGDATALTPEPPKDVAQARRERVQMLSRLETAWREFTARNAPPEALRALIAARQLDWMRFTVQTVLAPDVEVAREVTLCVREDGRPIEQVAAAARLRAETIEWWLEDVEPAVREALVGAMPGDVLGPLALKEGHLILAVGNQRLT